MRPLSRADSGPGNSMPWGLARVPACPPPGHCSLPAMTRAGNMYAPTLQEPDLLLPGGKFKNPLAEREQIHVCTHLAGALLQVPLGMSIHVVSREWASRDSSWAWGMWSLWSCWFGRGAMRLPSLSSSS